MRPSKLRYVEQEQLLVFMYDKMRAILKREKNCNQFYIANQLKKLFKPKIDFVGLCGGKEIIWYEHPDVYRVAQLEADAIRDQHAEKLAVYFGVQVNEIHNISYYIGSATPAAIVQMVKRIRKQVQNYHSML